MFAVELESDQRVRRYCSWGERKYAVGAPIVTVVKIRPQKSTAGLHETERLIYWNMEIGNKSARGGGREQRPLRSEINLHTCVKK